MAAAPHPLNPSQPRDDHIAVVFVFHSKHLQLHQQSASSSSSSSAALQPGVGFGLLYKVIPFLSISSQLLPILHLEHFHIFKDFIDPSILGSSCWSFPKWFPVG
jgi:hypothetical protein